MDLIAYLFAAVWNVWPLLLLALVAWVINACRNPVKRGAIYTPSPEHLARERGKLQNTIRLTGGGSVRRGRQ